MHAPTASQVRRRVPRFAWNATQSGATTRWSQQLWPRCRRPRRISPGADLRALNAPGLPPFHQSCSLAYCGTGLGLPVCVRASHHPLHGAPRPYRLAESRTDTRFPSRAWPPTTPGSLRAYPRGRRISGVERSLSRTRPGARITGAPVSLWPCAETRVRRPSRAGRETRRHARRAAPRERRAGSAGAPGHPQVVSTTPGKL